MMGPIDAADHGVIVTCMAYTVRMFSYVPDEEGNLPGWELGDPPRLFETAEDANDAGKEEVSRMFSEGVNVTFLVLDPESRFVEHDGTRSEMRRLP